MFLIVKTTELLVVYFTRYGDCDIRIFYSYNCEISRIANCLTLWHCYLLRFTVSRRNVR